MERREVLALVAAYLRETGCGTALLGLQQDTQEEFGTLPEVPGGELLRRLQGYAELQARQVSEQQAGAAAAKLDFPELSPGMLGETDDVLLDPSPAATLEDLHPSNIICAVAHGSQLVTAGADGTCRLVTLAEDGVTMVGEPAMLSVSKAPLLSLALRPGTGAQLAAVGDMAGQLFFLNLRTHMAEPVGTKHSKYLVRVAWSADGAFVATASYDKSVQLFRYVDERSVEPVKTYHLRGAIEGLTFTPATVPAAEAQLLFTARDDHLIHVVPLCDPQAPQAINMNELGDDFCSFTAMSLAVSPDGRFILAATDKNRLILFHRETGQVLRSFYGADNNSFSQPCCCFHPNGRFVLATSQNNEVLVWSMATQRQVATLRAHTATIRSLTFGEPAAADEPDLRLVSCGFDKTVRVWDTSTI